MTYILTSITDLGNGSLRFTDEHNATSDIDVCDVIGNCSIGALSDVTVSTPTSGQVLGYNGSRWKNVADNIGAGGDGGTISVSGTACIDMQGDGSSGDPVYATPVISPAQDINGSSFENALTCTSAGLFVPCSEIDEPTAAFPYAPFTLRIPCGAGYVSVDITQKEVILDSNFFAEGDPTISGADIYIDTLFGSLYHRDGAGANTITRLKGTYEYRATVSVSASPANVDHNLDGYVMVQVYQSSVLQDNADFTITRVTDNRVTIASSTVSGDCIVMCVRVSNIDA